jgi:hypothetical protein
MKSLKNLFIPVLVLASALPGSAAETPKAKPAENKPAEKPPLVIQAQGFSFSVTQPDGWLADEQAMKKYQANLAFASKSEPGQEPQASIVIQARRKVNENVALSLESDKQAYRQRDPGVQFSTMDVKHPLYAVFPQLISKPGEYYVYTTYLNPKGFEVVFSVVMPKKKSQATPQELAAYQQVVESLRVIPPEDEGE